MASGPIVVRTAVLDDLPAVFRLGELLFTPQQFPNLYRVWDAYEVTGLFHSDTEFFLVAEIDDQLAGFAMGTVIEKARTAWNYAHLIWLGANPAFHRSGVASKIFDEFRSRVQEAGARMLLVDTQADNAPALAFFRKKGFSNPTDHVYLTMGL